MHRQIWFDSDAFTDGPPTEAHPFPRLRYTITGSHARELLDRYDRNMKRVETLIRVCNLDERDLSRAPNMTPAQATTFWRDADIATIMGRAICGHEEAELLLDECGGMIRLADILLFRAGSNIRVARWMATVVPPEERSIRMKGLAAALPELEA